jgi:hypothetical protein
LLVEHGLLDDDGHLRGEQHQHLPVVLCVGVEPVALKVEDADDLVVGDDGGDHLGAGLLAGVDVARVAAHVGRDDGLARLRDVADEPLPRLQAQLHHLLDVVAAHGLGVEDERARPALAHVRVAADEVDARRVVGEQRVERVHHEHEDFLKVERAADLLRDVQQQTQLVHHAEPGRRG